MKTAEEWFIKIDNGSMRVDPLVRHIRDIQADALRWAAAVVNENITRDRDGKGTHYTMAETRDMIIDMANTKELSSGQ